MKEKKQIVIVVNQDVNIFYFRQELVNSFLRNGYQVTICCPKSERTHEFEEWGCSFIDTPINARGKNPFSDLRYFIQLRSIFKKLSPLVVFSFTIKSNIYATYAASLLNIPACPNITGLGDAVEKQGLIKRITLFLSKRSLSKSRFVFFQNNQNLKYYEKLGIVKPTQTILLPGSGVNLVKHKLEKYPSEENGIKFLFVGRLLIDKGIIEYLNVANKFKSDSNISFSCMGALEDSPPEVLSLLKESNVSYLGYFSDVHSIIKQYHAVVLPSYHEGMANVLLESAACGRPIIATSIAGCKEIFDEGITGLGCKAKDVDCLHQAILKFNELSEKEHELMGLKGREKVEKSFSRDIILDNYGSVIEKIEKGVVD